MEYSIKAHPTKYKGTLFRSRFEARWAAFFDLAGWEWQYEPIDLDGWTPDFFVKFPCSHRECSGSHSLFVEVKPFTTIEEFYGHKCMNWPYGENLSNGSYLPMGADASAAFGCTPSVTYWEMAHGSGGGTEDISGWLRGNSPNALWVEAGNLTRYQPSVNAAAFEPTIDMSVLDLAVLIKKLRTDQGLSDD